MVAISCAIEMDRRVHAVLMKKVPCPICQPILQIILPTYAGGGRNRKDKKSNCKNADPKQESGSAVASFPVHPFSVMIRLGRGL